jgi:hypothetical protein
MAQQQRAAIEELKKENTRLHGLLVGLAGMNTHLPIDLLTAPWEQSLSIASVCRCTRGYNVPLLAQHGWRAKSGCTN